VEHDRARAVDLVQNSAMPPTLALSQEPEADALLSRDPLALLIGMVLDQQVPLEWAFSAPLKLRERLGGTLDAADIASMDPDELTKAFVGPPALHRFPAANAKRVQDLCRLLVEEHGGRAENVWAGASDGAELLRRIKRLPGFGDQKGRIFVGLLGKQLGVQPPGWEDAAGDYGRPGTFKSVADIVDPASLSKVRAYKQEMKRAAKAKATTESPAAGGG
jgi:uncharacterized HhH-GPD family protein